MPVLNLSNNQLLPPNQRASDVAAKAVEGIANIQQQKINAAFHVQGIQCILYHHLDSGKKCSCQSSGHKLNARLGKDGKASFGLINQLLTGGQFGVSDYDGSPLQAQKEAEKSDLDVLAYSGADPMSSDLPTIWNSARNNEFDEEAIGDDGVHRNTDLVDEYNGFDYDYATFGDHACPICFGHGYVGGYSVYNGYRKVIPCENMNIGGTGILNVETSPYSASSQQLSFEITLPKGVVAIDACRLLNNWDVVPAQGTIDGLPMSPVVIRAKCDGKKHLIAYHFKEPTNFTHFEFQVNLSKKSAYLEFPKLSKNQRMDIIDRLDDFQLLLSPDIPTIDQEDVICDCMLGKAYYVQNTSWLNTRERQMLGWECNVRVVQPQEAFNHLPRRYRTKTRNMTVNPVIGNIGRRV